MSTSAHFFHERFAHENICVQYVPLTCLRDTVNMTLAVDHFSCSTLLNFLRENLVDGCASFKRQIFSLHFV